MKEIRSFFEEPKNYIYGFILGISSFSGFLFWVVENGLSFHNPSLIFKSFIVIFFGIPGVLPFYHLVISGRNRPREFVFLILGALFILNTLFAESFSLMVISFFIWIGLFIFMLLLGKSLSVRSDKSVWIRENAMIEIFLIILGLILILFFTIRYSYTNLRSAIDIDQTFLIYQRSISLRDHIEKMNSSAELEKKIYNDGDDVFQMNKHYAEMRIAINSDSLLASQAKSERFVLDPESFIDHMSRVRHLSISYHRIERVFRDRILVLLRHFQVKGVLILIGTALLLLVTWFVTTEKEEVSDRIRSHFFIVIILIFPLLRKIEKLDISIDRPFGFSFLQEVTEDRGSEILLKDILKYQGIIAREQSLSNERQLRIIENVFILDSLTKSVDVRVVNRVNEILTDEGYVRYLDAVTQDKSDSTKGELRKKINFKIEK